MNPQTMVYDVPSNLNANAFTNRGYSFIGWSENKDGSDRIYLDRDEVVNLVSSNNGEVTLYAQWVKNKSISITYNIKTDDNDGDSTVSISNTFETFTKGERPSGSKASPSDAYDFIGWFDSAGTLISSERFLNPGEVSEDTVYTAYFKRKEFNVRFLDNDGSVISEAKVKCGHSAIAPNPPIHDGFNFTGWDKKFDYITGDLDVTAVYEPNSVLPGDKGDDGDTDNDNENAVPDNTSDASNSNSGAKEDNANISGNVNADNTDTSADMGSAAAARNILNELIQTGVNIAYLPLIAFLLSIVVFYGVHRKKHRN